MRVSRPNAMKFFYKDSCRHFNLQSNMTGKRVLNISRIIFVRKVPMLYKIPWQIYKQLPITLHVLNIFQFLYRYYPLKLHKEENETLQIKIESKTKIFEKIWSWWPCCQFILYDVIFLYYSQSRACLYPQYITI